MGMIIHSSVMAQPNADRRQGTPPPREHERGDHRGRDHSGPGPRKGERMRPEQREKIEMFKIQFITKNLELTKNALGSHIASHPNSSNHCTANLESLISISN